MDEPRPIHIWYLPRLGDLLFLVLLARLVQVGQTELLNDPGTTWHLQIGLDILKSRELPRADQYSFTRAGQPWISQYWLGDVAAALLYRGVGTPDSSVGPEAGMGRWTALVMAAALAIAWTYWLLYRHLIASGTGAGWAVLLVLLAAGAGGQHWLVRPHLFTLAFVFVTLHWTERYRTAGENSVFFLPLVFAVWANVHGGFLGGLLVVGTSLVGHLLSGPWDGIWRRRLQGLVLVAGLSAAATLVNPYGLRLHRHLWDLLSTSGVTGLIDEYQSPDFQRVEARPFEVLMIAALVILGFSSARPGWTGLLHLGVWLHFALQSVRHVPLAAGVFAQVLGPVTRGVWASLARLPGVSRVALGDIVQGWTLAERARAWPIYPAAASVLLAAIVVIGAQGPGRPLLSAQFSESRWPAKAVAVLNQQAADGPIFHDLSWGGYLIFFAQPPRPVFIDDRFELYGRAMLEEYRNALAAGPAWERLLAQYKFRYVLISPRAPLARLLRTAADWKLLHADPTAILLMRNDNREAHARRPKSRA